MQKATLALLVGGLLPAILFGASGVVQKMSARAGIATGPFLIVVGLVVILVGAGVTLVQQDTTLNRTSAAYAAFYGLLWAAGIGCIALALGRYDARISQLVPLYNMNTLVAVAGGLVLLSEWRDVRIGQLLLAAGLTIAGGILAAGSTK
ncbi:MAG: hypothetical protein JWO38_4712 [Gemmataceae bacterium]|nr:hypothetical protein [Gemmataceae bacterium]